MKRSLLCVVAALVYCSLPAWVCAEGFLPGMPSLGGWSCAPAHKANCSVAGKLGYLGYPKGFVFAVSATQLPIGNVQAIRYQYPVEGLWVAAEVTGGGPERGLAACEPGGGLCLTLGASWLFPNNKEADEQLFVTAPATAVRTWQPRTQWYTLDASASRCAGETFSLIGGFRYDSFSTSFSNPTVIAGTFTTDEAELILTSVAFPK